MTLTSFYIYLVYNLFNMTKALFLIFALAITMGIAQPAIAQPSGSNLTVIQKAEIKLLLADGKKYYSADNYKLALLKFREVLTIDKKNAEANYWISECHLELGNYEISLKYGKRAEDVDPYINKELHYVIGQSYHRIGDVEKAVENYNLALKEMSKSRIRDFRIQEKIEECKRAEQMIAEGKKIEIKAMGPMVNSKYDDYAPILTNNGKTLYFSARRAENEGGGFSSGDNKYFSDIFVCQWNDETNDWSESSNSSLLVSQINSSGFDDIAFITHDGQTLYYSVNTEGIIDAKINTQSTDIYYASLKNERWSSPKPIDRKTINSIYFEASPTFTEDGNTMYFISERIGGLGRADIWVSRKVKSGWTKPENIGETVNTPFQETTVFVSPDGQYLFFSSEGHGGMGGYDVYVSKNINGEWSAPKNLGSPINGFSDETHFAYYPKIGKAYYSKASTKKNKGLGKRDIFEIDLTNFDLEELFSTP